MTKKRQSESSDWIKLGKRKHDLDTWQPSDKYKRPYDDNERQKARMKRRHEDLTVEEQEKESKIPIKRHSVDYVMW